MLSNDVCSAYLLVKFLVKPCICGNEIRLAGHALESASVHNLRALKV